MYAKHFVCICGDGDRTVQMMWWFLVFDSNEEWRTCGTQHPMINGIYFVNYVRSMGTRACATAAAGFKDSVIGTPYAFHKVCLFFFFYLNRLHNWPNAIQTVFVVGPFCIHIVFHSWYVRVCVFWLYYVTIAAGETFCLFRVSRGIFFSVRFDSVFVLYTQTHLDGHGHNDEFVSMCRSQYVCV